MAARKVAATSNCSGSRNETPGIVSVMAPLLGAVADGAVPVHRRRLGREFADALPVDFGNRIRAEARDELLERLAASGPVAAKVALVEAGPCLAQTDGPEVDREIGLGMPGKHALELEYVERVQRALGQHAVDRPAHEVPVDAVDDWAGDQYLCAVDLVQALDARAEVDGGADHRVVHAVGGADVAHDGVAEMQREARVERRRAFARPALVPRIAPVAAAKDGEAAVGRMARVKGRGVPVRLGLVADELVDGAAVLEPPADQPFELL